MTVACPSCGTPLALVPAAPSQSPSVALSHTDPHPDDPPWLLVALGEMGVREVPGAGDNPRIVEYHAETSLKATNDATPWCASFVSWCLERAGVPSTRSARALSYAEWGRRVAEGHRPRGAVVVFDHVGGKGHVGFLVGHRGDDALLVLGGNQGDAVKVSEFGTTKLHSLRWPEDTTR